MISNSVSSSAGFLLGYFIIPIGLLVLGFVVDKVSNKKWGYWAAGIVFIIQILITYSLNL